MYRERKVARVKKTRKSSALQNADFLQGESLKIRFNFIIFPEKLLIIIILGGDFFFSFRLENINIIIYFVAIKWRFGKLQNHSI